MLLWLNWASCFQWVDMILRLYSRSVLMHRKRSAIAILINIYKGCHGSPNLITFSAPKGMLLLNFYALTSLFPFFMKCTWTHHDWPVRRLVFERFSKLWHPWYNKWQCVWKWWLVAMSLQRIIIWICFRMLFSFLAADFLFWFTFWLQLAAVQHSRVLDTEWRTDTARK